MLNPNLVLRQAQDEVLIDIAVDLMVSLSNHEVVAVSFPKHPCHSLDKMME